jgi:hypothetical protein
VPSLSHASLIPDLNEEQQDYIWTAATLPSSTDWYSVTYGNGKFVAVVNSSATAAAYSTDGINWTAATMPSSANWHSVTYGNGKFVEVSYSD